MRALFIGVCGYFVLLSTARSTEILAPTPPMGWSSWNTFQADAHEQLIKDSADAMIRCGMRDAGYIYVNIDDGWSMRERDAEGNLVPDPKKFPSGMKALGDYLHQRRFKFGIFGCAGAKTCSGYPGSKNNEERDAKLFASWGVDYLKYDWCETEGMDAKEVFPKLRKALDATGRPIVLSMCEWGQSKPWEWAEGVGQLWRTTGDITDCYDCKEKWYLGWKRILDSQVGLEKYAGRGHWNDPDMLVVGRPRMTLAENRAHFSLWCMLAAPLITGNDIRNMSEDIRLLLTNDEAIAINQDPLCKQGYRYKAEAGRELWVKPLSNGEWAVCLFNTSNEMAEKMVLNWDDLDFLEDKYHVRDVLAKKELGNTTKPFTGEVTWHDVALFRLRPDK